MSKLDSFFAFQIGDFVRPKFHQPGFDSEGRRHIPQGMVIVERSLQECYGGIQANYGCRVHSVMGEWREKQYAFSDKLFAFTEPELAVLEPRELSESNPEDAKAR